MTLTISIEDGGTLTTGARDAILPRRARLIEPDDRSCWAKLNSAPFLLRHNLANHPLLELSHLASMAERAINNRSPRKPGLHISNSAEFNEIPIERRFSEAIMRIESGAHWVKFSALQDLHEDYKELLESLFDELEELTAMPLKKTMTWAGLTVFISSPNYLTPYHFDHDANFLFQIKGNKDVHLFDQNDPSIVTQDELERYYRGDPMAGRYRAELQDKDQVFHLAPGRAVHHPPLAPHIVKNQNNVSISLSVYYSDTALDARARIHQANYCLRRLGFRPSPPGESGTGDRLKNTALKAISKPNPKTWEELIYSGVNRIFLPSRAANWLANRASAMMARSNRRVG